MPSSPEICVIPHDLQPVGGATHAGRDEGTACYGCRAGRWPIATIVLPTPIGDRLEERDRCRSTAAARQQYHVRLHDGAMLFIAAKDSLGTGRGVGRLDGGFGRWEGRG